MMRNVDAMVHIIEVNSEENTRLVRLLFQEYQKAFLTDTAFQKYLTIQNFESELAQLPGGYAPPNGALLLATYADESAGCVALKKLEENTCEMKRLYVKTTYRGLTIGKKLASAIIERAKVLGYRKMRLDTLSSMTRAQALYKSLGFLEIPPYCESPVPDATYFKLKL